MPKPVSTAKIVAATAALKALAERADRDGDRVLTKAEVDYAAARTSRIRGNALRAFHTWTDRRIGASPVNLDTFNVSAEMGRANVLRKDKDRDGWVDANEAKGFARSWSTSSLYEMARRGRYPGT